MSLALRPGRGTVARRAGSLGYGRSHRRGGEHCTSPLPLAMETPVRSRLLRPALSLALLSSGVFALGASAAPAGPVAYEDVAGDGNMLNTQIFYVPAAGPGIATPGSQPGLDIVKVEFKNMFSPPTEAAKVAACRGFQVVMTLSGPPEAKSRFSTSGRFGAQRFFLLDYDSGTKETSLFYRDDGGDHADHPLRIEPAVVRGSTITWTLSSRIIQGLGQRRGSVATLRESATSFSTEGFSLPVFGRALAADLLPVVDRALAADKKFTVCR